MFKSTFSKYLTAFIIIILTCFLILSGIIGERAEEVRSAVLANGFTVEKEISENDWVGMLVRV